METWHYFTIGGGALALAWLANKKGGYDPMSAAQFIIQFEGFSAHPYWDVSRYSWGYGTQAPGSSGTIDPEQALDELQAVTSANYQAMKDDLTVSLNRNQWTALSSFAYNLGIGNGLKMVQHINQADPALGDYWNQFVHAGGVVNDTLVDRRAQEWQLFNS